MSDQLDPILQQAEQNRLKEQLFWRLGIAAGLIIIVLGGIWLLDRPDLHQDVVLPGTPRPAPIATLTTTTPASTPASAPTASAVEAHEIASTPIAASTPQPTATEAPTITPTATRQPEPAGVASVQKTATQATPRYIANAPLVSPTAVATLANATTPASKASISDAPATPRPGKQAAAEPVLSMAPLYDTPTGSKNFEAHTAPGGYAIQAGVFMHQANADKLLRQVQNAGIPAYLETRVQIGPFKNKADADAAIKKLRALGIEPVVHAAD